MQPEKKYHDDMDYLAQLGYAHVALDKSDLRELKKKIKKRSFSLSRIVLMLASLITGMLLGGLVIYSSAAPAEEKPASLAHKPSVISGPAPEEQQKTPIMLDTITVADENFINTAVPKKAHKSVMKESDQQEEPVSADVIVSKPLDLSLLQARDVEEKKIKYILNAPVFYLHDMKITNYTTLYFKKNQFVELGTLSAVYSHSSESVSAGSSLKESARYFLHEEIASAMLQFKKENYDAALRYLKSVWEYNREDLNCQFYTALCYYHKKNYKEAIALLDECISSPNNTFLQEAMYYKALALHKKGSKKEARLLFQKIVMEGEFYSEKAKRYLND
jgi:hypothetical protein